MFCQPHFTELYSKPPGGWLSGVAKGLYFTKRLRFENTAPNCPQPRVLALQLITEPPLRCSGFFIAIHRAEGGGGRTGLDTTGRSGARWVGLCRRRKNTCFCCVRGEDSRFLLDPVSDFLEGSLVKNNDLNGDMYVCVCRHHTCT